MPEGKPLHFAVLLFPGFEVLDCAGPIECLNTLSRKPNWGDLRLHIIARTADAKNPITPANPSGDSSAGWVVESAQKYLPTHTLDNPPERIDVLIVPGGYGSLPPSRAQPEVDFIQKIFPNLMYLFTVCTGAGLAAASGVLDGWRATTNKSVWDDVTASGPNTYWVAHARWEVSGENGKIWTTSGVSAGTDGMIGFIKAVYGKEIKDWLVPTIEWIDSGREHDPFADYFGCKDVPPVSQSQSQPQC